jgi:hypothetical protein
MHKSDEETVTFDDRHGRGGGGRGRRPAGLGAHSGWPEQPATGSATENLVDEPAHSE